ncbi:MAG: hypothetical protein IPM51_05235 [Sphingobacteriaceae bacterium]|nr:hypothetical protein [Sphingobacteriaceae bacterium]
MNVIISHDIDHITVSEHFFRDTIIPKYLVRMQIELLSGKISFREYILRWSDFFKNKWQNIDELITFNNINGVPSSFFVAVSKGVGLNYSNEHAIAWIEQILSRDCELGIHGIAYDNIEEIKKEFELFKQLSGLSSFGIRMHYVRKTEETFKLLDQCGYIYDSTTHEFKNPYKIGEMWEFPIQIMDGWVIENGKRWQSVSFEKAQEITLKIIDKAHKHNLEFLSIDFHDRYFSHSYNTWLKWYMWLIEYLKQNGFKFVNHQQAIRILEK